MFSYAVFQIEAELTKERTRHLMEFQEQALLFKEEAKLELDIEKEKHQEVVRKYQQEQEDLQKKVCRHCLCHSPGTQTSCSPQACLPFYSLIVRSWLPCLRSAHTDKWFRNDTGGKLQKPTAQLCMHWLSTDNFRLKLTPPHN